MAELPFDVTTLTPTGKAIYDTIAAKRSAKGAPFDGPYSALMNHPELCEKVEALGYYLKFEGHLPREVYQFVVLAVAKATGAEFEWHDHVNHALAAGVPQGVINKLHSNGINYPAFPPTYQLAAEVLTSTLKWQNIPQEVQTNAIATYTLKGYLEIVVLSGFYQMFSAINQGFDIRPIKRK